MDKIKEMELRDKPGKHRKTCEIEKKLKDIAEILEKDHQSFKCPPSISNILIILFVFITLIIFIILSI